MASSLTAHGLVALPVETWETIVSQLDTPAILSLQRVSAKFHSLASAQLYRDLSFSLTADDAEDSGGSSTNFADALQTINTSEFNYAKYIKYFRLRCGVQPAFGRGRQPDTSLATRVVFRPSSQCSKLLNTAVLQVLRRASILESFIWAIPVELSGQNYSALQRLQSLSHLHIRLDVLPLPKPIVRPSHNPVYMPTSSLGDTLIPYDPPPYHPAKHGIQKSKRKITTSNTWRLPKDLQGFRTLGTLEVTHLTSMDGIPELAQCINSCAANLRHLTVTVDPRFGNKEYRPMNVTHSPAFDSLSDSTDLEAEDLLAGASGSAGPHEPDRRQQKADLESLLAQLFSLQASVARGQRLESKMRLADGKCFTEEDEAAKLKSLESIATSLRRDRKEGEAPMPTSVRLQRLKKMRTLADQLISKQKPTSKKTTKQANAHNTAASQVGKSHKSNAFLYTDPMLNGDSLDDFSFEQFLDEHAHALESPGSPDSAFGGHHSMSWPDNAAKAGLTSPPYSPTSPPYSMDLMPPLPPPDTTFPSLHTTNFNNGPSLPHPSSYTPNANLSSSIKPSAFPGQDAAYHTSYSPFGGAYADSKSKSYYGKSKAKNKYSGKTNTKAPSKAALLDKYSQLYLDKAQKKTKLVPAAPKKSFSQGTKNHATSTTSLGYGAKINSEIYSSDSDALEDNHLDGFSSPESPASPPLHTALPPVNIEKGIEVDMDHPDEDGFDSGEDQETLSGNEVVEVGSNPEISDLHPSTTRPGVDQPHTRNGTPGIGNGKQVPTDITDKMQDYIRVTHGLQLDSLRLQNVPLKAPVLGKAVDLQFLQRVTFLEVGRQDAFWALLAKLTSLEVPITFKSIHTDDISMALLRFLRTFSCLEELLLHERKPKTRDPEPGSRVDVAMLRNQALRPHLTKLKVLMIRNERDGMWDFDFKTLHLLALQGRQLQELAINLKTTVYHNLLQILPAFRSLRTLQMIVLRGLGRAQLETLCFTADHLVQYPDLSLQYIAIGERVMEIQGRHVFATQLKKVMEGFSQEKGQVENDKKGKGKRKAVELPPSPGTISSDDEFDDTLARMQTAQRGLRIHRNIYDIEQVKIFSSTARTGRL